MSERVVIIGAGHAGFNVADALRRLEFGGEIILVGDEPHPPYQRPPLSKGYLTGAYDLDRLLIRPERYYRDHDIVLKLGAPVASIDPKGGSIELADNSTMAFDRLVLATGSRMRQLNVPGQDLRNIFYLRTHDDAAELLAALADAEDVAVIGGGFIGLEVAATARNSGKRVTVLEAADRLMARGMPPLVSDFFERVHRSHGVDVRFNSKVTELTGMSGQVTSVIADGDEIRADIVLVGIGVIPATELAEHAGLTCRNGIVVDEFAKTSAENIWAVGDCTYHFNGWASANLRLESVQNATDQAKTAASSIVGIAEPYNAVPWFWSDQYDLKLQIAGVTEDYADEVVRGDIDANQFSAFYYSGDDIRAVYSVNRPGDHMATRRLLSAGKTLSRDVAADVEADLKPYIR